MRKFVLAAVLVLMASGAQAATLNVVGGILYGASGVIVDGSSYNVEFLNGTCISLYDGCDSVSDFTFQSEASAVLASQALLDQVFLDGPLGIFDTNTTLTSTCWLHAFFECVTWTPFAADPFLIDPSYGIGAASITVAWNKGLGSPTPGPDFVQSHLDVPTSLLDSADASSQWGFAVWSVPVPEPGTALLLGLGLVGLAARRRSLRS